MRSIRARRQTHTLGTRTPSNLRSLSNSWHLQKRQMTLQMDSISAIGYGNGVRLHRGLTSVILAKISIPSVRTVFINGFKILYGIYHGGIPIHVSTVHSISYYSKLSSWNQRSDSCFTFVALIDSLGGAPRDPACRRC